MDQKWNTRPQGHNVPGGVCRCTVRKIPEVPVLVVWLRWSITSDLGTTLQLDQLKDIQKRARNNETFPTKPVKKAGKY